MQGIVIFLHDITENEQIRVKTQQLEQRAVLGEVTAIFAHEVRNPINNISMGLQLLGTKFAADDPNQELIGRLQTDCTRLTHLMESVLSFSRPMEFKMETDRTARIAAAHPRSLAPAPVTCECRTVLPAGSRPRRPSWATRAPWSRSSPT